MARSRARTVFVCESCGNDSLKWEGRCPSCGEWNTLVEAPRESGDGRRSSRLSSSSPSVQELAEVSSDDAPRLELSSTEVNRVLGGGIVPGSLVLIAGDPGIGKSTMMMRVAADIAESVGPVLYATGEESAAQIRMRADRLGISGRRLLLLPATDLNDVIEALESSKPRLVVVDSIQTMHDYSLPSAVGSVAQIRECTRKLLEWAKASGIAVLLTGHVTKGGDIAGPRVLEHMVDVVLYMEGDPVSSWRLLRAIKNRFGSTNEVGVFEMSDGGLIEVEDPSSAFLSERANDTIGSVVVATLEGSRPLLVEVQALTSPSMLPAPRRVATGIDFNRLLIVCAVLGRRMGIPLSNQDVLVNVTGGLRITEPAADLGVALAIASSLWNSPVGWDVVALGEVGLGGEIRRVPQVERRIGEAARLGLKRCLVPGSASDSTRTGTEIEVVPVATLAEALDACIPRGRRKRDQGAIDPQVHT